MSLTLQRSIGQDIVYVGKGVLTLTSVHRNHINVVFNCDQKETLHKVKVADSGGYGEFYDVVPGVRIAIMRISESYVRIRSKCTSDITIYRGELLEKAKHG